MDFHRKCLTLVAAAAVALTLAPLAAWSALPTTRAAKQGRVARPARVLSLDSQRRIDINNVNMFVTNFGSWAYDLSTGNSGLYFPRGTNKTAIFAGGVWFGATVGGEIRTVVGEYSQEYAPGQVLPDGSFDDPERAEYVVYKVARYSGDPRDTSHVERAVAPSDPTAPDPLVHHSWSEYMAGAVPFGAPWRTYRLPNPDAPGDSVDVPGPDVSGDLMLWSIYNDLDPGVHTNDAGNSAPLGLEIRQSIFGFDRQGALGNTVFIRLEIVHPSTSTETLDDMYVSLWADPDLGEAGDDVVGTDTTLSLGYVYNATNNDPIYGTNPPAVGYDFFQGPTVGGEILPLTSFNKYINGTDPNSSDATYNYMQGLQADGSPLIDPTTGRQTRYFNPGDPVTGVGWLDANPSDKRMMLNSGPFTMAPGDTQIVVGAIVVAQGSDRLASVTGLKFFDSFAQAAFDSAFNLPPPPPQPQVTVNAGPGRIQLCWDAGSQNNYIPPPGYKFEGYVVYQGSSRTGPWRRLATYDIVDSIGVVRDTVFDTVTGQLISDFPVAFGGDNALSYCYTTETDAITGGPLNNASQYYFAVTAYAVPENRGCLDGTAPPGTLCPSPRVLETSQQSITATPAYPALGTDVGTARTLCPDFVRADSSVAGTTDQVQLTVVDPAAVTGHTYAITYAPLPEDTTVNGEVVSVGWNLLDLTTGETLLSNQVEKSGNEAYQIVDGIQVKVAGTYSVTNALNTVAYFPAECPVFPSDAPPFIGVDAGLEAFDGGAGTAATFALGDGYLDPVAQADSFTTVEVRFSTTERQHAYRYFRKETASGGAPAGGRGYTYAGYPLQNFTVWDVTNNIQLEVGFVERAVTDAAGTVGGPQPATQDSLWAPDESDLGGREYFFISKRPYTGAPDPALAVDAGILDDPLWEYAAWLHAAPGLRPQEGDVLRFVWGFIPGTPNDTIRFETRPLVRGDAALARSGLGRIRVVPNPYYNRSRYELSQFNRVMRFTNLPEQATIRIFSLSGQLVRTLHKTDPTSSMLDWDLQTENRLPVASGVYVYHVESPGVGTTHGRLVVFMEKERLNTF